MNMRNVFKTIELLQQLLFVGGLTACILVMTYLALT